MQMLDAVRKELGHQKNAFQTSSCNQFLAANKHNQSSQNKEAHTQAHAPYQMINITDAESVAQVHLHLGWKLGT
ncbi:hypothetical protein T11_5672 [Trichinella zimbabwensis]|uniref:Uncharacterized protein n=1 Tax=Trichinella zimbabwensis TaxID=268475 RepID=A0A0V1HTA2_9BILA|nr:hypothetical protein T11_5672 [Trichinella zimbabwensis]